MNNRRRFQLECAQLPGRTEAPLGLTDQTACRFGQYGLNVAWLTMNHAIGITSDALRDPS